MPLLALRVHEILNGEAQKWAGYFFLDEAWLTAYEGHLEFERGNLPSAAGKWKESFEIEYNGIASQHKVDAKNAKIKDVVINVISGAAAGMTAKPGEIYTYPIQTTVLPTPAMMRAGIPSGTVLRFPVRVERPPFGNIVRFQTGKNSCTASMVSSRVAITAAHCMSNGAALKPSAMSLQKAGIFQTKPMKVLRFYTHRGENAGWDGQRPTDWLILVTDTPKDTFEYSKVLRDISADLSAGNSKLMLAGYSSDLNQGSYLTLHYGCTAKKGQNLKGRMYFTNCENAKGSSGAPVMTADPPYYIVGVHTALITAPKDEFYSVETFSNDYINALEKVAGPSVIENGATPIQTLSQVAPRLNIPSSLSPNVAGKYLRIGVITPKGVTKETFIDVSLLKGPKDNLDITVIRNFSEQKNSKNIGYKSEINKLAMNCNRKYQLVEVAYYSEDFAVGSAVESHNFKALGANTWLDIPIGTHMENIHTMACSAAEKKQ